MSQRYRLAGAILGLLICLSGLWEAAALGEPAGGQVRIDQYGDPIPGGVVARLGTLRFRHGHFITSIAFAPDGKSVATTDSNRVLYLWDAATGNLQRRFVGQSGGYAGAPGVFSPDGRILAAGDGQRNLILWEADSGKEVLRLPGKGCLTSLAFSPDGKTLALGGYGNPLARGDFGPEVGLLNPTTGNEIRRFVGHKARVASVAFTPDGRTLATGSYDNTVRLWEVTTGKELRQFSRPKVQVIAFSPDGKLLATGGGFGDSSITVLETATGTEIRRFKADDSTWGLTGLTFSPDGTLLASAGGDQTNRLWNVATGEQVRQFNSPAGRSTGRSVCGRVAFSPDGKLLACRGPHDAVLCLWEVASGRPLHDFDAHLSAVLASAVSPDGKLLATGAKDGSLFLWESATDKLLRRLEGHTAPVSKVVFAPDSRTLASLGADQSIRLWEPATGRALHRLSSGDNRSLAFSPDGRTLAAGNTAGAVTFWEAATGKQLRQLQVHPYRLDPDNERYVAPVSALAFSPDGKSLATGLDTDLEQKEEVFYLYDLATSRLLRRLQAPPGDRDNCRHQQATLAFSPDGRTLLTGSGHKLVRFWEIASGKERRRSGASNVPGPNNWPYHAAFSADGKRLATWGHQNSLLRLWDAATGKELAQLRGHQGYVHAAAFSPDGRRLITGCEDTTILVWDIAGFHPPRPAAANLSTRELDACWNDLAGSDAVRADRAIEALSAAAEPAVTLLARHLQPAAPFDVERVQRLIAELDSEQFAVREKATEELDKLGQQAEDALTRALSANPSPEVRRRVEVLLGKLADRPFTAEQLCIGRSIEVLERIASPEARRLLEKLAGGAAGARPTEDARASLRRLAGNRSSD